jgi:hypothetical protein
MRNKSGIAHTVNSRLMSAGTVAETEHIPYRTVCYYAHRSKLGLSLYGSSGRPRLLEDEDILELVHIRQANPDMTMMEIKEEIVKKAKEKWRKRHTLVSIDSTIPSISRKSVLRYYKKIISSI